jgi:hypothetical protein
MILLQCTSPYRFPSVNSRWLCFHVVGVFHEIELSLVIFQMIEYPALYFQEFQQEH